ncbi:hypothetical protein [Candidatus Avelusimicrobium alvi]|uniref:hypothetical protein n=1 Tax=Candidatus Avelusimicrobium alvi TaxID=3416221 RepID=UPI003D152F9A
MKRVLTVLVLLSGACVLHAEEMKFVTTLSSPLGTFAQLETADYSATTSVPLLNFCNTRSSAGTVALKGADTYLQTLSLKNGTTLGGNTPEYRISGTLSVNNNSEVTGGRLLANTASLSGASSAKSQVTDTLYMSSMKVKGAKAGSLTIPSEVQTSGSGNNDELEWSNIYTKDYKSDGSANGSKSYTSYLLKTKVRCVASEATACTSSKGTWDDTDCSCTCPSNMILKNGKCIGKFSPKVIDVGVLVDCHYCPGDFDGRKKCGTAGADPTHCYYGGDFDPQQGCCRACSGIGVNSYTFYQGGSLKLSPKEGSASARWLWWEGGKLIGGQMYRYSGGSMPNCYGSDYQALCDNNCTAGASSCSYKCLISKTDSGCSNGTYSYSGGTCNKSCNNASGTGKVLTCVSQ